MRAIREVVFVVFFGIGAAVLSGTVLCDDFLEHFHNKNLLKQAEVGRQRIETLNTDYDELLGRFVGDPCQLARLAPATLGIEPNEPNTVFPRASADKLAAARQALSEEPNEPAPDEAIPEWLGLCCRWPRRQIFFSCGAALVLISFVFFGPPKRPRREITVVRQSSPEVISKGPLPTSPDVSRGRGAKK
jgi:hypothetical protein